MANRVGCVYFFTGLSGSGKTTLGGLFYKRLRERAPDAVLMDGDTLRAGSGDKDYSTEARRRGAMSVFRTARGLAEEGHDVVVCCIGMYHEVRDWNRANLEWYKEIYVKVSMDTLYRRDKKGLYSSGAKQVVGVDLPWDEPETPDFIAVNDSGETPESIVDRIEAAFGLRGAPGASEAVEL